MTTQTAEGIGRSWGELGIRPAKAIKDLGGKALSAISSGQIGFEALMTRATTRQPDLEHVARRAELSPPVRDRLLSQGAIHSLVEDGREIS